MKRERINLSQEQKKLNVERQKRITEYKRLQTLRKIKADEEKVRNIEREKARMLQKRKAAAIQVKVQKDQIAKGLEALRLTKQWDKAGALLTNITSNAALDGKSGTLVAVKRGDDGARRYVVVLAATNQTVSVRADSLILPRGALVETRLINSKTLFDEFAAGLVELVLGFGKFGAGGA